ncbi:MAG: hypothetical protein AAB893_01560 [Patescibacteria group bacterium]
MKIYKKDKRIIFEVSSESARFDPYSEKEYGSHPTLVGLIAIGESGNRELGWAEVIDMAYKDKPDQFTDYLVKWWGSEEEFRKICREIEVDVVDNAAFQAFSARLASGRGRSRLSIL